MEAANNKAKASTAAAKLARATRDQLLYDPSTSVLKLVKLIKATIKQTFAPTDPTYKAIMALQFKNPLTRPKHAPKGLCKTQNCL